MASSCQILHVFIRCSEWLRCNGIMAFSNPLTFAFTFFCGFFCLLFFGFFASGLPLACQYESTGDWRSSQHISPLLLDYFEAAMSLILFKVHLKAPYWWGCFSSSLSQFLVNHNDSVILGCCWLWEHTSRLRSSTTKWTNALRAQGLLLVHFVLKVTSE